MAPGSAKRKMLKEYIKYLHFKKNVFHCPLCRDLVLPKDFEKHCTAHHNLNSKLCCVWCLGAVSWPNRAKTQNAPHLFHCSRRFYVMRPTLASLSIPESFNATPLCNERDAFGRAHDLQPKAYEDVWLLPLSPVRITYEIESLNLAMACVRAYLERDPESYWCHGIVRAVAFQRFLEAMDADKGRTRSLPFSCWCDGGQLPQARFRSHRHMILVSLSEDHFEKNVWGKIQVSKKEKHDQQFRAIHREPIRNTHHLVNALGYVSQRKSVCQFSSDPKNEPEKLNHYQVRRSLPRDYRLALFLEWPNGLNELLNQEFKNIQYDSLIRSDMVFVDSDRKYKIPIRSIPGIKWGKRLPLARNWHPCDRPTPHYIHLLNGKTVFFQFKRSLTDFNLYLYDAVQGDLWTPRPFHQTLIRQFRPYLDRNTELEKQLKEKDQLHRTEIEKLQAAIDELRTENVQLRAENDQLCARINQPEHKTESERLQAENVHTMHSNKPV